MGKKAELFISDLSIAEVIWVMEEVYENSREEIRNSIGTILNTPNLLFQNKDILAEAIVLYASLNVDFIDAYHTILAQHKGMEAIISYDQDFDRLARIKRKEP